MKTLRQMDAYGLKLCRYQAELFESSAQEVACSSKIFIRRFMNSDLAARMDSEGFFFEATDKGNAYEEIEEQYGKSSYGKNKLSAEELHWLGYIYRYWVYISGRSSKQVYRLMTSDELGKLYFPYHSLDPRQAIERIAEAKEVDLLLDTGDLDRCVRIVREARARHHLIKQGS